MQNNGTKKIVRAGLIAGLYVVLSIFIMPVASGPIQFRLSESLCVLPLIFFEAVPALFVGCMLSNLITGCAIFDVIIGSLITLFAGTLTFFIGKIIKKTWVKLLVGGLFPVFLNAFLLPLIWFYCYGKMEYLYLLQVVFLTASQSLSVYFLGTGVYLGLSKMKDKGIKFLQ